MYKNMFEVSELCEVGAIAACHDKECVLPCWKVHHLSSFGGRSAVQAYGMTFEMQKWFAEI